MSKKETESKEQPKDKQQIRDEIKRQGTIIVDGMKKNKTIWINGPTPPFSVCLFC